MKKTVYTIAGMHCASCAMMIEGELEDRGVTGRCSFTKNTLEIDDGDEKLVKEAVEAAGYTLGGLARPDK